MAASVTCRVLTLLAVSTAVLCQTGPITEGYAKGGFSGDRPQM